jgi:hypothetical protein
VRRIIVIAVVAMFALVAGGALPAAAKLSKADQAKAIKRVESAWGECLALVGTTTVGATVRSTSSSQTHRPIDSADHKPVIVTLATGEMFIVHLKPGLRGAATFGNAAASALDAAAAKGGHC